jgi:flagellar protein FliJ
MSKAFNLAGLLRLRQIEREHAASDLAAANRLVHEGNVRVQRARAQLADVRTEAVTSADLLAASAARASSRSMLAELNALLEQRADEANAARDRLNEASRRSTGLEKLEARHDEEQRRAELSAEQRALDELAARSRQGRSE